MGAVASKRIALMFKNVINYPYDLPRCNLAFDELMQAAGANDKCGRNRSLPRFLYLRDEQVRVGV